MRGNTYALLLTGSVVLLFSLGLSSSPPEPDEPAAPRDVSLPKVEAAPGPHLAQKQPPPPPKDPPIQTKAPADPVEGDEQTLKNAKLECDGDALLKFFRDRTLP